MHLVFVNIEKFGGQTLSKCRNNDVVFLYKTGGPGYIGVFLAKGWVVFEADGNGKLEKKSDMNLKNTIIL